MKEISHKSKLIFNHYQLKERSFKKSNYSTRLFGKEYKDLKICGIFKGVFLAGGGVPLNEVLVPIRSTHYTKHEKIFANKFFPEWVQHVVFNQN